VEDFTVALRHSRNREADCIEHLEIEESGYKVLKQECSASRVQNKAMDSMERADMIKVFLAPILFLIIMVLLQGLGVLV